ncbi:uncharacterized protein LOC103702466 [Phoenix dactylifera]|uniref:Uncharacterized protein LOC103702466 n=1 Tax=Phoenix dactylifera TaxID=42345 RepID=A0A8B8J1H5_PHODC|nr:uncharacterized protein LOC103702466 [Phoenix dactylifera]
MRKKKTTEAGERAQSHRSGGGGGSELFICFTARHSSSATSACAATAMRVPSSKSLLSPGRGREPPAPSLSASLSRRLRSSGSLKGGQSPMFPAGVATGGGGGRRKGCAFEAAEPSSPKVTCIGQVRVKSKKKKAKAKAAAAMARSRSKRGSGKEASFRRTEECLPRKNERWMHQLPASICGALRSLGSELNCFFPCGSSPCSSSRTGEEKRRECEEKRTASSCGQVLARWLMAMQEGEGKRGKVVGLVLEGRGKGELDLVIGEREKIGVAGLELEVANGNGGEKKDEVLVVTDEEEVEEVAAARDSVCIPPRNALLLMRCRSDPVRMAALANRFWGSPAAKVEEAEEEQEEEDGVEVGQHLFGRVEVDREEVGAERDEEAGAAAKVIPETGEVGEEEAEEEKISPGATLDGALVEMGSSAEEEKQQRSCEGKQEKEGSSADWVNVQRNSPREEAVDAHLPPKSEEIVLKEVTFSPEREEEKEGEEEKGRRSSSCSSSMGKAERRSHNHKWLSKAKEGAGRSSSSKNKERRRHSFSTERDVRSHSYSSEKEARRASFSVERRRRWSFSVDKGGLIPEEENAFREGEEEKKEEDSSAEGEEARETEAIEKPEATEVGETEVNGEEGRIEEADGKGEEGVEGEEAGKRRELPDCLLLMMYEPKLSMEVSKETWVCSTDFLRWRPHHHRRHHPKGGGGGNGGGGAGERAKTEKVERSKDMGGDKKEATAPAEPALLQASPPPPPPAPPTATAVEQKLMSAAAVRKPAAYGPFVLTRCKSEPMRSSARLAPDACFWKDRHRPIGAAGIGF